ncbi:hypothetical protein V1478_004036 [Vespula squamosa]|uniref:Uncharacterized protein n=1 Tax=Vespula squamosa TaxID=30214 RepID=A0ABD2BNH8_VESSQ
MILIKSLLPMRKSLTLFHYTWYEAVGMFRAKRNEIFQNQRKHTPNEGTRVRPVEFLVEQPVRQSVGSSRHDGDTSSTRLFGCEYMRAAQGVLLRASHENARRQELPPADRGPKIASETNDLSTFHDEDETPSIPPSLPSIPLSTPSPSLLDPPVVKTSTKSFGSVVFEIEGKDSISTR